MIEDSVIIGAGPAGLCAALQLTRYGVSPFVLEAESPGGLIRNAHLVENYPGFPDGISGPQLADRLITQALTAGVNIVKKRVDGLYRENNLFRIRTGESVVSSRTVIIASGTKSRRLTGIVMSDQIRKKVFYEVRSLLHNDNKHFVIVGAGDAAFDYALNLGRKNIVTILNRSTIVKCLPLLQRRAAAAGINYIADASIFNISEAPHDQVHVQCLISGEPSTLQADYVVVAIGRDPQTDFIAASLVDHLGELEEQGILHMAGDVKNGIFRQTAIAAGDGIMAGMSTCRALKAGREKHEDHC